MTNLIILISVTFLFGFAEKLTDLIKFRSNVTKGAFKKVFKWFTFSLFIIFSIISGWFSIDSYNSTESQNNDLKDSLKSIKHSYLELKKENSENQKLTSKRIDGSTARLMSTAAAKAEKASTDLRKTASYLVENIAGTEELPGIRVKGKSKFLQFMLHNQADYPLYTTLFVINYESLLACKMSPDKRFVDEDCYLSHLNSYEEIKIYPHRIRILTLLSEPPRLLEDTKVYKYFFQFDIKADQYIQQIYVQKLAGRWVTSKRTFKLIKGEYRYDKKLSSEAIGINWSREFPSPVDIRPIEILN